MKKELVESIKEGDKVSVISSVMFIHKDSVVEVLEKDGRQFIIIEGNEMLLPVEEGLDNVDIIKEVDDSSDCHGRVLIYENKPVLVLLTEGRDLKCVECKKESTKDLLIAEELFKSLREKKAKSSS